LSMPAALNLESREAISRPDKPPVSGDARRYVNLPNPFRLWRGGELRGAQIAYESWGQLNNKRDNAVLLFTGLSPTAHAKSSARDPSEGWWERMIGPGLPIDTNRLFVICVNSLGSCFGSTGPRSINPVTGEAYRLRFPELSVEDIARGGFEVIRAHGIGRLRAVIGPSLGGMAVMAFAAQFPRAARSLISISGTTAASPFAIALRSIQREAVRSDPYWLNGQYPFDQPPIAGLRLARKLGTVTYGSATEWAQRFAREPIKPEMRRAEPFAAEFSVEDYLEAQARRFVRIFDANCYLYLSRAMDRFNLADHGGGFACAALERSGLEQALVMCAETDMLFALQEQRATADALSAAGINTSFVPLPCAQGHDAFLVAIEQFGTEIRAFLDRPVITGKNNLRF
jgi:homoserine O-acetyltransferase/O-succinyltransferase